MKKKWIAAGIVLGVGLFGYGGYLICRPAPSAPGAEATPKERLEFMASADFKRLPVEEQRKFLEQRGNQPRGRVELSEEQRKQLNENTRDLREQMMKERLKAYFAKSEPERLAELKQRQQQMAARQKEMEQRRSANTAEPGPERPRGGDREQRLRERLDSSDPETRAMHTAMMKEMRRAGIQPSRPPRG